jgi:quercetin dioxygenase-like cupin family protein
MNGMSITILADIQRFDPARLVKAAVVDSPYFFCDVYCLEPGQAQAVHAHADSDKVYYVLDGQAAITLGEQTHTVAPGGLAHAPAGLPHGVRNDGPDRLRLLVVLAPRPRH